MINLHVINKKEFFPIILILILALSRLIPHPPNFTPVVSVAIMSGYLFKNIYLSFATLLVSMILADAFIGFYENMLFVYLSLLLIAYFFYKIAEKINLKNLFFFSILGSVIFYLISNFGFWYFGNLYEKNFNGLMECYFLAIPFFKNTILSTVAFTYATFIADNFFRRKIINYIN